MSAQAATSLREPGFAFSPGMDTAQRTQAFFAAAGQTCAEWINWLLPLDERIVLTKDGSMLAVFSMEGLDLDSTQAFEVNKVRGQVIYALEQLQEESATVWWQVRRRWTTAYPNATFPDPVSQSVDDNLHRSFLANRQYINRHAVILSLAPHSSSMRLLQAMRRAQEEHTGAWGSIKALLSGARSALLGENGFPYQNDAEIAEALEQVRKQVDQFAAAMSGVGLRALKGEALGGFLELACSPTTQDLDNTQPLPAPYLDTTICSSEIDNDYRDVLKFSWDGRDVWAKAYSLDLSRRKNLSMDMLDGLLAAPFEFTLSHVFKMLPKTRGEREVASYERYHAVRRYPLRSYIAAAMKGGEMDGAPVNQARVDQAKEAEEIKNKVSVGKEGMGLYYGTVIVQAETPDALETDAARCVELLQSVRVRPIHERLHKFSSWASTVPGSHNEVALWNRITTENFADLCPVRTVYEGQPLNEHLTEQTGQVCTALLAFPTLHRTPLYFTGYVGALGHGMMIGPSDTGKTSFVNLLWTMFRKYPNASSIIFDKDYSTRPPVLLQGGNYLDLNPEAQQGKRARMNPLRALLGPEHEGRHITFIVEFFELLAKQRGYEPTSQDHLDLQDRVRATAEQGAIDPAHLRLSSVVVSLDSTTPLARELMPWTAGHILGAYFDNEDDNLDVSGLVATENGFILNNEDLAAPYMFYCFYRISAKLRALKEAQGSVAPTFIYVPEMWYFLKVKAFQEKFFDFLVTLRKLNGVVWLDTQSPDQLVHSGIYSGMRDNVATTVLTPNHKALTGSLGKLYRDEFLLSDEDLQHLATGKAKEDYFIKQGKLSRRVKLRLEPEVMAVLRSDKKAQMLLDRHMLAPGAVDGVWQQNYLKELSHGD